jgi:hypothetical protein
MDVGNGPSAYKLREQRDSVRDAVFQNTFMGGMGSFADRAKSVERRNAQRGGEVTVRASSG